LSAQSKAGCDALIAEFKKRETKLHVLVNNSGISWGAPYSDFPEEKGWDNVFAVNVKSIFYSESCASLTSEHSEIGCIQ
jgi:NAD(P)-dependent dehydrogenase (short-subunit alcohol dehydrogenase family)